tara:strand:+ start:671 stop:874 length:204 start_codon:yes stop_codon:yes gene_type:complete
MVEHTSTPQNPNKRQMKDKSTQHERLEQRQKHCGGFMYRLIDTWYHADANNKLILEKAFKDTAFDLT